MSKWMEIFRNAKLKKSGVAKKVREEIETYEGLEAGLANAEAEFAKLPEDDPDRPSQADLDELRAGLEEQDEILVETLNEYLSNKEKNKEVNQARYQKMFAGRKHNKDKATAEGGSIPQTGVDGPPAETPPVENPPVLETGGIQTVEQSTEHPETIVTDNPTTTDEPEKKGSSSIWGWALGIGLALITFGAVKYNQNN